MMLHIQLPVTHQLQMHQTRHQICRQIEQLRQTVQRRNAFSSFHASHLGKHYAARAENLPVGLYLFRLQAHTLS